MSGVAEKLESIIARAEADVLRVVAEAAASANYERLDVARDLAGSLHGLRKSLAANLTRQMKQTEPASQEQSAARQKVPRKRSRKRVSKVTPTDYPKFMIANGCLCKVAWSKKKKSEYTHRLPLPTVSRFLDLLENQHATGKLMTTESCLAAASEQGNTLPAYQFYIVIGLLKKLEAARPVGREGFSLKASWRSDAERFIKQHGAGDNGASR